MKRIAVRVYGPLNDFLPPERRWRAWTHAFDGRASVKDVIEGLGVLDRLGLNDPPAATGIP